MIRYMGCGAWRNGDWREWQAPSIPWYSGSIYTPDILNAASFESGWDGFTDWAGNVPPQFVSRDNTTAYSGSWSVLRTWVSSSVDAGSQFLFNATPGHDRLWVRHDFKLTASINSAFKYSRWYDTVFSTNLGGLWIGSDANNGILQWCWDQEDGSILTPIGLTEAQVIDGKWHSVEYDYWRNGDPSGWPSVGLWFDGKPQYLADGTPVTYQGAGNKSYWLGGRLYAGERISSLQLGYVEWLATLNGGQLTSGSVNIDNVSISSLGHIGP